MGPRSLPKRLATLIVLRCRSALKFKMQISKCKIVESLCDTFIFHFDFSILHLVLNNSEARCHRELACLSAGYARLGGTYQGITNSFAANIFLDVIAKYVRSTCMPNPRRQRSS